MPSKTNTAHIFNIKQAIDCGSLMLKDHGIERYRLEAEILLGFVLCQSRVWLHTHFDTPLTSKCQALFFELIEQRLSQIPIEYLTKSASFFEYEFFVDFGVLVPRPESEILVKKVIELVQTHHLTQIAEIGVGSAALSISIAKACPNLHIIATDISQEALHIAKHNITNFHFEDQITLKSTSLLDDITQDFELVFSNPPYISLAYPLQPNVLFEPHCALFGGECGSEILEDIIALCARKKIAFLACEMGYDQKERLNSVLLDSGYKAEFYRDLAQNDRGFVARYNL